VLVKEAHRALYVSDLSHHEYNLGLRLNMPLAHAKAIAPDLIHVLHDDEYFRQEFLRLSLSAMVFSPHVAVDDNYGLVVNITGCANLFGGEPNMLSAIKDHFLQLGFYIQPAIAPNPLLAKALAYCQSETIVDGPSKNYLENLPTKALFIDETITRGLYDLGIVTIGALARLPKKMLAKRFGINLINKLDQLNGSIHLPLTYLPEKPQFVLSEHFTSPIRSHEYFIQAVNQLIEQALGQLNRHYLTLSSMVILLEDSGKKIRSLSIASSQPNNELKHWCELVFLQTQDLRFKDGIDSMQLQLTNFERIKPQQNSFSKKKESINQLSFVADKLKSRLGSKAVFHLRKTEKYLPEHGVVKDFLLTRNIEQQPQQKLPHRPIMLLKKPIPVTVIALLPDNPPAKIMWHKQVFNVLHANGPERIESPWWDHSHEPSRDYYYIEDDRGKRLWIYSYGQPKSWFIHGIFA